MSTAPIIDENYVPKRVELDRYKMELGPEGLKDYFWPLSFQERKSFAKDLVGVTQILRDSAPSLARPYQLIAKNFLLEACTVFQGDALAQRFEAHNVSVQPPSSWRCWPRLFRGRVPEPPLFLKTLRDGPRKVSLFQRLLRPSLLRKALKVFSVQKGGVSIDGLKIEPFMPRLAYRHIIATQRGSVIGQHAAECGEDVYFMRSERWFSQISQEELALARQDLDSNIEKAFIQCVRDAYRKSGVRLSDNTQNYLNGVLLEGAACFSVHYARLLEQKDNLPRRLWTGSFGHLWDSVLGVAVADIGGEVSAHDHGAGSGHTKMIQMPLTEFWGCTHYIAFNEGQAAALRKMAQEFPTLDAKKPKVNGLKSGKQGVSVLPRFEKGNVKVKTIILLASLYDYDRGRIGIGEPDNFWLDWHARLVEHLQGWGYEVIIKLHPESQSPPDYFEKKTGVEVTQNHFEEMYERGDLFLFDFLYTTAFSVAIKTNVPMLFVDFYGNQFSDDGLMLFEKRASYVLGDCENNRAHVDWESLKQAIENASAKCDNREFVETFYL